MTRKMLCLLLIVLLVIPVLAEDSAAVPGLAEAWPAYQRFRKTCQNAGYTLLPEAICQVEYSADGERGYASWEPLTGVAFSFYQQSDDIAYPETSAALIYSVYVDHAFFPNSQPLLSLALAAIDPGFTIETAAYYLTRMEATLTTDESSNGALYTVFEGLRSVYALIRGESGTQLLIYPPDIE